MFTDETRSELAAWNARKFAQWEEFAPEVKPDEQTGEHVLHGLPLHLVRSGEANSEFMLVYSSPDFYEGIIFGQLPQVHRIATGRTRRGANGVIEREFKDATEEEKPRPKKRIDLTNGEIDAVLALWEKGRSALELTFIDSVFKMDGKEYFRS